MCIVTLTLPLRLNSPENKECLRYISCIKEILSASFEHSQLFCFEMSPAITFSATVEFLVPAKHKHESKARALIRVHPDHNAQFYLSKMLIYLLNSPILTGIGLAHEEFYDSRTVFSCCRMTVNGMHGTLPVIIFWVLAQEAALLQPCHQSLMPVPALVSQQWNSTWGGRERNIGVIERGG